MELGIFRESDKCKKLALCVPYNSFSLCQDHYGPDRMHNKTFIEYLDLHFFTARAVLNGEVTLWAWRGIKSGKVHKRCALSKRICEQIPRLWKKGQSALETVHMFRRILQIASTMRLLISLTYIIQLGHLKYSRKSIVQLSNSNGGITRLINFTNWKFWMSVWSGNLGQSYCTVHV